MSKKGNWGIVDIMCLPEDMFKNKDYEFYDVGFKFRAEEKSHMLAMFENLIREYTEPMIRINQRTYNTKTLEAL